MIAMAGSKQKPLDAAGRYRKACDAMAKDLGWKDAEVYGYWRQIAMMVEYELGWPRSVAEWHALRVVADSLYKQGSEGS